MQDKIDGLTKQMNSLGVFKGKEKKALQAQIDAIKADLGPIESVVAEKTNAIQAQIDEQAKIIEGVDAELSKDR